MFSSYTELDLRYIKMTACGLYSSYCSMSFLKTSEEVWIHSLMSYRVGEELRSDEKAERVPSQGLNKSRSRQLFRK